jgi:hypothetical protein
VRSLLWFAAAYVTLAISAAVARLAVKSHPVVETSLGYVAAIASLFAGMRMIGTARRHWVSSADIRIEQDPRPPVLYLRSFHDDALLSQQRAHWRTHEEMWAQQLKRVGPVVALGAPGRELPHLGAARRYETESEWQNAILEWMRVASLVVLFLGDTEAFSWEVEQTVEIVPPERLVFLLPSDPARWPAFRAHFQALVPAAHLPVELPGRTFRLRAKLPARLRYPTWGALYFDADWTARLSKCTPAKKAYLVSLAFPGALSRARIYGAMRPVLERNGIRGRLRHAWEKPALKVVLAFVLMIFAFAIAATVIRTL